jgi:hypothetical protein
VSVFSLAPVLSQTRKGIGCVYAGTTNWKQHLLTEIEGVPCLTLVPRLVPLSPYSYRNVIKLDENEILQFKITWDVSFSWREMPAHIHHYILHIKTEEQSWLTWSLKFKNKEFWERYWSLFTLPVKNNDRVIFDYIVICMRYIRTRMLLYKDSHNCHGDYLKKH